MALNDTLEALAASYRDGRVSLAYMACVVSADSIAQMLKWCRGYDIDVLGLEHASVLDIQKLEREYKGWNSPCSK